MRKAFIINGAQRYSFSPGKLNQALVERTGSYLTSQGLEVQYTQTDSNSTYKAAEEVSKHLWADLVILQFPVNWMMVPWSFKRYMDEVFTAGMAGKLCKGDGRSDKTPEKGFGTGGTLQGKKYMLSLTLNAPENAFNNPEEYLFKGKSVDDLMLPVHSNYAFFGMEPLPTFTCFDVMKRPSVEEDLARLEMHLSKVVPTPPSN